MSWFDLSDVGLSEGVAYLLLISPNYTDCMTDRNDSLMWIQFQVFLFQQNTWIYCRNLIRPMWNSQTFSLSRNLID